MSYVKNFEFFNHTLVDIIPSYLNNMYNNYIRMIII